MGAFARFVLVWFALLFALFIFGSLRYTFGFSVGATVIGMVVSLFTLGVTGLGLVFDFIIKGFKESPKAALGTFPLYALAFTMINGVIMGILWVVLGVDRA